MNVSKKRFFQRVQQAYLLISKRLDEPLNIDDIAQQCAFSLYHFHRLYRAIVGENLMETHRRLRLERATEQLVLSDKTITLIALDAGYESLPSFSKAFKHHFGVSPTEYRCRGSFIINRAPIFQYPPQQGIKMKHINIEQRPACTVFGLRHVGPYHDISPAFDKLWGWVFNHHLAPQVTAGIAIYYDDPAMTPPAQCRADACVALSPPYPTPQEGIKRIELAAGTYATYRHIGSYHTLEQAYQTFYRWLPESGYECADSPCFEIYRNNPQDTPEEQLITDIYVLLVS